MKSTEAYEERLKRVDMHDYFLNRIKSAMSAENYIEANWLIYACFENRYFRTVQKYRTGCKYCRSKSKCNKKDKNEPYFYSSLLSSCYASCLYIALTISSIGVSIILISCILQWLARKASASPG